MTAARVSGMTQAMRGRDRDPSRRAGAGCGRAASEALDGRLVSKKKEGVFVKRVVATRQFAKEPTMPQMLSLQQSEVGFNSFRFFYPIWLRNK